MDPAAVPTVGKFLTSKTYLEFWQQSTGNTLTEMPCNDVPSALLRRTLYFPFEFILRKYLKPKTMWKRLESVIYFTSWKKQCGSSESHRMELVSTCQAPANLVTLNFIWTSENVGLIYISLCAGNSPGTMQGGFRMNVLWITLQFMVLWAHTF